MRAEVEKELQPYWSSIDEFVVIKRIAMEGERIIIPASIQGKVLNWLHMSNIGIEMTRLLVFEFSYSFNMHADIEGTVKIVLHVLILGNTAQ